MSLKIKQWIWIGSGGALGTLTRVGFADVVTLSTFPFATLLVNLLGSLLLGGFTAYLYIQNHHTGHLFFGIGFCGSFTTMSMFAADVTLLLTNEKYASVSWYIGLSVVGGLFFAMNNRFEPLNTK